MTACARRCLLLLSLTLVAGAPLRGEPYGHLPLRFEVNQGQTDGAVRFISRGRDLTLFLGENEVVLAPVGRPEAAVRMRLLGAGRAPAVTGMDRLPGESHYLIGNDPKAWTTHVPGYARVRYSQVYPGIDLAFHGDRDVLEFDFEVSPGADPKAIRMAFKGMDRLGLDQAGGLVLATAAGDVVLRPPRLYQEAAGRRLPVAGRYVLGRRGRVGFEIAEYDRGRPLVIDPAMIYSTYLGGSGGDSARGIAVDSEGNAYVTGHTNSTDFPTSNSTQPAYGGGTGDAFVVKLDPLGNLVYSTYVGGTSLDRGNAIEVDASGNAWVAGSTFSSNFPAIHSLQPFRSGDAFVALLAPDGSSLLFSTFLGGAGNNEDGLDIALDGQGNAYVAGDTNSADFPRVGSYQSTFGGGLHDAFVAKLNPASPALLYSTYLGGAGDDVPNGVAVDANGSAYITGRTASANFPLASPFRSTLGGFQDGFVTRLAPSGSVLVYSTYLGGAGFDSCNGIAVDAGGSAIVAGETTSNDFPVVNPVDPIRGTDNEGFVARFNAAGSALLFSTFLGGTGLDRAQGVVLDGAGRIIVTGDTTSTDFPLANPVQAENGGVYDSFVTVLNPTGTAFLFSTYLGGSGDEFCCADIAVDGSGDAYVTGETTSIDYPTLAPAQAGYAGSVDAFVTRMSMGIPSDLETPEVMVENLGITWTPVRDATGYDVVRGDLGTLLASHGDFTAATAECLADDFPDTALLYQVDPPRGRASWFLVRWVTPSQVGTYDRDGVGQVGLRDAEIQASPVACPPALRPHAPIVINDNTEFTAANGVVGGAGTAADPYLIAFWDIAAPPSGAGISISGTTAAFAIRGVHVHGGQYGVQLVSVANGRIEGIKATKNTNGVRIVSGSDIAVVDSTLSSNTQGSGLEVLGATRVLVKGNTLAGNMIGINLDGAVLALVHHNNVLNNALQSIDQRGGPNAWDDGYPSGGNYWTNYTGADRCSGPNQDQCAAPDGLGDTPYLIGPDHTPDRYPLMILPGSEFDAASPGVAITFPSQGAVFTAVPITVRGTASDPGGSGVRRAEVRLNGGAWVEATGVSPWSLSVGLVPGQNLIEARSIDHAGNVSPVASVSVFYQTAPLESAIQTNTNPYNPGEQVQVALFLTNPNSAPVTLHFPSGCEAFFDVTDEAGTLVYDYRLHVGCPAVVTERTIQPNETVTYLFDWNQVYDSGAQVPAGAGYRIRGYFDSQEPVSDATTFISIAPQASGLSAVVQTNKLFYAPGERVLITHRVTNNGPGPVTLNFPTTCQAFFAVMDSSDAVVYDDGQHAGCLLVLTQLTLQPGQTAAYSLQWLQTDDSGQQVPPSATYRIRGYLDSFEPTPDAFRFIRIGP